MKTTKVGSLRFLAAGIIAAGAVALPLATSAAAQDNGCADASPSELTCENTTTTTMQETTTTTEADKAPATVAPTTTAAPEKAVENEQVSREKTATVLNSTATNDSDELAFTGGDAAGLAALGAGALALGGGMMLVRRRRSED